MIDNRLFFVIAAASLSCLPRRAVVVAFQHPSFRSSSSSSSSFLGRRGSVRLHCRSVRTLVAVEEEDAVAFNPMNFPYAPEEEDEFRASGSLLRPPPTTTGRRSSMAGIATATGLATAVVAAGAQQAVAIGDKAVISQGSMDPASFVPVCPTSDGFYRFLQASTEAVVGTESFTQYGPLIAGGLLRVRLELCVVESFINEAVVPFVRENGVSWILPIHETVETFLAGSIFAVATTFILIGSTKILTVIVTYADFLVGVPSRVLGGFVLDRASGKPVTLDVGFGPFKTRVIGPEVKEGEEEKELDFGSLGIGQLITVILSGLVKAVGTVVGFVREALDALDFFVGKYLFFWASFYILIKFVHFKILPDFP